MFKTATQEKYRYPSIQGNVTTEDLWDLPLTSRTKASLNGVAKAIAKLIREDGEESFVEVSKTNATLQLKMDIVKHVIASKQAANAAAKDAIAKKDRNTTIMAIIAKKQNAALEDKSIEELMAELS